MKFIERIPNNPEEEKTISTNEKINTLSQTENKIQENNNPALKQPDIIPLTNTESLNTEENFSYVSEKALEIDDIYKNGDIDNDTLRSIYIIDSFLKALPETLPNEAKRQSVLNIISASGINLENLLEDGQKRLHLLHNYCESFTSKTEEIIKQYEIEIKEFTMKIEQCTEAINKRNELQKEQDLKLDYEMSKIESIIKFIKKQ